MVAHPRPCVCLLCEVESQLLAFQQQVDQDAAHLEEALSLYEAAVRLQGISQDLAHLRLTEAGTISQELLTLHRSRADRAVELALFVIQRASLALERNTKQIHKLASLRATLNGEVR